MKWLSLLCVLAGCYDLFVDPPTPQTGGAVNVVLNGGMQRSTAALGDSNADPMKIEGASAEVTFSLIAGDTAAGSAARSVLKSANGSVDLVITATSRSRLEVHLQGMGCLLLSGMAHLTTDGNVRLSGDFSGQGMVTGGTASCTVSGNLGDVPVVH